ncbi:hypothetical protein AQJ30_33385 [Streptomyces longwoodensis]|uniref:Uncharacterized protein n=1 Tax=Streptomyces longwoodensis TaxID=68231 RepID=A0A124HPW6_9ACTN|nr:hypothetical protein AQJ30_33385 [Streptomyces longwoodensis]
MRVVDRDQQGAFTGGPAHHLVEGVQHAVRDVTAPDVGPGEHVVPRGLLAGLCGGVPGGRTTAGAVRQGFEQGPYGAQRRRVARRHSVCPEHPQTRCVRFEQEPVHQRRPAHAVRCVQDDQSGPAGRGVADGRGQQGEFTVTVDRWPGRPPVVGPA